MHPDTTFANTSTGACATTTQPVVNLMAHRCRYGLVRVTGNQHQRTEHRACKCGKVWRRVIRWADRSVTDEVA